MSIGNPPGGSDFVRRAKPIVLLLSDVDGVLNDGRLSFDDDGHEWKQFHIRDGLGVKLWQSAGHRFGIVTGRKSAILERRAAELGITILRQGAEDKLAAVRQLLEELAVGAEQTAYIGDDLPDLPAIRHVGLGVAVADACAEALAAANFVTKLPGGHGAVRELIEQLLQAQGIWSAIVGRFTNAV